MLIGQWPKQVVRMGNRLASGPVQKILPTYMPHLNWSEMLELAVRMGNRLVKVPVWALVHLQQAVLVCCHQLVTTHTEQTRTKNNDDFQAGLRIWIRSDPCLFAGSRHFSADSDTTLAWKLCFKKYCTVFRSKSLELCT